jgi:hypothetical protein
MADSGAARSKQQGLQQAASLIFALVAVVPLLIFAWTLNSLGVIRNTQAQIALSLALAVALLGFWMFRSMLGRMAEVVQALGAAVEQASRSRRPATPAGAIPAAVAAATSSGSASAVTPSSSPARRISPPSAPHIPGVGNIREIAEVARTMDVLWQREATAHVGKRVQISVANSRDPLVGIIGEVSDDGLILNQDDGEMAVAYRRVTAIERCTGQS